MSIGYPEQPELGEQGELVLKSLDDIAGAQGVDAQAFRSWATAWVRRQIEARGYVWTDELNVAAKLAFMEPKNEKLQRSIYGTLWNEVGRTLGIRRTSLERTGRGVDNNGRKARCWVPEDAPDPRLADVP